MAQDLLDILFGDQEVAPNICETPLPCDACPRFDDCSFRDDRCRNYGPQVSTRDVQMFAAHDTNMGAVCFDYHTVYAWHEDGWGA